jgi:hypothetical protein
MSAQLRPVASEILRRIIELSCVAGGVRRASKRAVRQMRNGSETSGDKISGAKQAAQRVCNKQRLGFLNL